LDGFTQGSYFHIVYYGNQDNKQIKQGIDSILTAIDQSISLWNENSMLTRVNKGEKVKVDKIFKENLALSHEISLLTEGAFDITIGGLVKIYGFANKERRKLGEEEIQSLLKYVNYNKVSISEDGYVIKQPQTELDFNAIAQGYTTDVISQYLISRGISSFVVDVGGEVFAQGRKPDNQYWKVAIEEPAADSASEVRYKYAVDLDNQSIVTSGSYRKYYEENGVKYSHTIDPQSGKPVTHTLLSVSVLADKSYKADGLATAFMVMGLEKSKQFLDKHKEYDAYFIFTDQLGKYKTYATEGFSKEIKRVNGGE
jgi:thiamine biosynthesis lipoprotein